MSQQSEGILARSHLFKGEFRLGVVFRVCIRILLSVLDVTLMSLLALSVNSITLHVTQDTFVKNPAFKC